MNVAQRFQNCEIHNFGASALYLLAAPSTPEPARIEAVARADRRMGEVLMQAKETGEISHGGDRKSRLEEQTLKLQDIGINKFQSHVTQQLAKLPEQVFEQRIERARTRDLRFKVIYYHRTR